jgi:hypothetical protein
MEFGAYLRNDSMKMSYLNASVNFHLFDITVDVIGVVVGALSVSGL